MAKISLLKIRHGAVVIANHARTIATISLQWLSKYFAPSVRILKSAINNLSTIPIVLCLPLGLITVAVIPLAMSLRWFHYVPLLQKYPELGTVLSPTNPPGSLLWLIVISLAGAFAILAASIIGLLLKKPYALRIVRSGYIIVYALFIAYAGVVMNITAQIRNSPYIAEIGGKKIDAVVVFFWRYNYLWMAALAVAFTVFLHLFSWRRCAINYYTGSKDDSPAFGDRFFENWRTHGHDPKFRKSAWGSIWTHIMIIIIVPWLLQNAGCVEPYRPPFGGGNYVVQMVKIVKPEKKKTRKNYILRSDSAIYFQIPDLDESKIMEDVEEKSKVTYTADPNAVHGSLGDGKGGAPGWQDGFKDGLVRFIRLEYMGPDWDDGMDSQSRADMNFLDEFKRLSGGMKTARHSESHPIHMLKKYPKGQAPPFVFMTGSGAINIPGNDIKILRDYLMEGGMLFADCGSKRWDSSFRNFARQIFPESPLLVISDDDPIFQIPFIFPNGAPPLWHHGGENAMGIKVRNRWVVFYHPGDINDAWKTGHSGIDPKLAEHAYQLGVNIVYYSFMRYFEETKKYRK
ncbi:MAG: DUF4159 domain-containing protein [Lentisphaerae bacterium]|nr:DUF4159 domain-containing protein [Lentisphaerota bacterium]